MTRFLILTAAAFVMVSAAIWSITSAYLPGATLADIFLFWMSPPLKLLAATIVVISGVGAVAGLKRNVVRVRVAAITAVAVGVLGAAYRELETNFGTLYDGEVTFAAMASGRLASLAILALGLLGAALGLGILKLRDGVASRSSSERPRRER